MSKDVILDKYARLYEIPNQLALLGHDVECFCLSYQSHDDGIWDESNVSKKLKWHSRSYPKWKKLSIWNYPFYLLNLLRENKPDVIIGASDMPHIIMGGWLANKLDIPFVADLYDNFEAYGQAKLPFIKRLFHRALNQAKIITTTSQTLAVKIQIEHPSVKNIFAMPSVIDQNIFKVGNKNDARELLGLPLNAPLIGTAGGLTKKKGIYDLFNAWEIIKKDNPLCYLVLAGPTELETPLPEDDRVIYLGLMTHQDIAILFQALDVGVMCIPDDEFGRYCFPQKAYEMLATNLAVVGTNIGDLIQILQANEMYKSGDAHDLAEKIILQIQKPNILKLNIPNWESTIFLFESRLYK